MRTTAERPCRALSVLAHDRGSVVDRRAQDAIRLGALCMASRSVGRSLSAGGLSVLVHQRSRAPRQNESQCGRCKPREEHEDAAYGHVEGDRGDSSGGNERRGLS